MLKRSSKHATRALWIIGGGILLVLGAIGIFLPLLPTTPFWIAAVACFSRSSPRLEAWILNHPRFGTSVRAYRDHGVIPRKAKRAALIAILISALVTAVAVEPLTVQLIAGSVLLLVACFIATRPEVVTTRITPDR